jgi:hypothetical protein
MGKSVLPGFVRTIEFGAEDRADEPATGSRSRRFINDDARKTALRSSEEWWKK